MGTGESELQKLVSELGTGESGVPRLGAELDTGESRVPRLGAELDTGESGVPRLGAELDTGEAGVPRLGAELDTGESRVPRLGAELDTGESGLQRLGAELDTGESGVPRLGAELDTGESGVPRLGAELDTGESGVPRPGAELDTGESGVPRLVAEVGTGVSELKKLDAELDMGESGVPKLGAEMVTDESKLQKLDAELDNSQTELVEFDAQLSTRRTELSDLDAQLSTRQIELSEVDAELTTRRKEASRLEIELTTRRAEVAEFDDDLAARRAQLHELEAGLFDRGKALSQSSQSEPASTTPAIEPTILELHTIAPDSIPSIPEVRVEESNAERLARSALTDDLLSARDLAMAKFSHGAEVAELRETVRQLGQRLTHAAENDREWAQLKNLARRTDVLSPRMLQQLQMAGDIDFGPLLAALGHPSSYQDVLTLNRDVAIGINVLFNHEVEVDVDAIRDRLRDLARELTKASAVETPERSRLHDLGRAVIFVATRLLLLFGVAGLGVATLGKLVPELQPVEGPEMTQAVAAIVTGALLHGLERVIDRTLDGPARKDAAQQADQQFDLHQTIQAFDGREFRELASRWDTPANEEFYQEAASATLLFLNKQVARLYLTDETAVVSPGAGRETQQCADLLAVLREARKYVQASNLDRERVSELLSDCARCAGQELNDADGRFSFSRLAERDAALGHPESVLFPRTNSSPFVAETRHGPDQQPVFPSPPAGGPGL